DGNTGENDSGAEAYSAGENVIVHDYSGTTTAYSWADGKEVWAFDIPGTDSSCHPPQTFASQSTSGGDRLGEEDLLLIEYSSTGSEDGCEPTSGAGNAVVYALDAATGEEAWPARTPSCTRSTRLQAKRRGRRGRSTKQGRPSAVGSWNSPLTGSQGSCRG